jgi:hypothetical protein
MNTKKLTAALATVVLAVIFPLATAGTGVAGATPDHVARPTAELSASSGDAGTASICSKPPTVQHSRVKNDPAPSRLSGLPFGSAGVCV